MADPGLEVAAGGGDRRVILPLRRRHWRWLSILAIVLPILLWAFLGSRDFSSHGSVLPESITGEHRHPEATDP